MLLLEQRTRNRYNHNNNNNRSRCSNSSSSSHKGKALPSTLLLSNNRILGLPRRLWSLTYLLLPLLKTTFRALLSRPAVQTRCCHLLPCTVHSLSHRPLEPTVVPPAQSSRLPVSLQAAAATVVLAVTSALTEVLLVSRPSSNACILTVVASAARAQVSSLRLARLYPQPSRSLGG